MSSRFTDVDLEALYELLFDPDTVVDEYVRRKAMLLSDKDVSYITKRLGREQRRVPAYTFRRSERLVRESTISSFIRETKDDYPDVPRCLAMLDRTYLTDVLPTDYGKLYLEKLDRFLPEFISAENKTLVEKAELFNQVFFNDCRFRIIEKPKDINDYLVYSLLKDGRGDIISLATLYTSLALSCGIDVCPVPAEQGGFRLFYIEDNVPYFFVDLQQKGTICPEKQPEFVHTDKDIIRFYFMSLFCSEMRMKYKISPATVFRAGINLF